MKNSLVASGLTLLLACQLVSCTESANTLAPTQSSSITPSPITTPLTSRPDTVISSANTTTTTTLFKVEEILEPLPADCRVSNLVYTKLASGTSAGVGGPVLWAVGPPNKITFDPGQLKQQDTQQYGWALKVLWLVEPNQPEPVRLMAYNQADRSPIWIDTQGRVTLTPVFPANPSSSAYAQHPSNVFFPRAGCYDFEAKWKGGGWKLTFAVGRQ